MSMRESMPPSEQARVHHMANLEEEEGYHRPGSPGPWSGWVTFGALMMVLLGMVNGFQGLLALFDEGYFVANSDDLVLVSYGAWGALLLLWGAVLIATGAALNARLRLGALGRRGDRDVRRDPAGRVLPVDAAARDAADRDRRRRAVRPHRPLGRGEAGRHRLTRLEGVAGSDALLLEIAGREVRVTSPEKVLFSERGETKLDLVSYYAGIAAPLMRAMGGRPVLMQRFPKGAGGPSFFQKRVPDNVPDWLETTTVQTVNGTPSRALVAADAAHVAWAVNLACLGFHVWPNRADDPAHADELRLDLDPQPGTGFDQARAAAWELKALLDEHGIAAFPKTTGNRGLHVYVRLQPRWDSYEVRSAAVAVARELERRRPDLLTAAWWKEERGKRIFVDYNQNAPHKTVFGAWSVRARKGAQISTPLAWDELDEVDPDALTLAAVPGRVERDGDPWAAIDDAPQSLEPLLEMNARDRESGLLDAPWPPVYPKQPDEPPRVAPSRARKD